MVATIAFMLGASLGQTPQFDGLDVYALGETRIESLHIRVTSVDSVLEMRGTTLAPSSFWRKELVKQGFQRWKGGYRNVSEDRVSVEVVFPSASMTKNGRPVEIQARWLEGGGQKSSVDLTALFRGSRLWRIAARRRAEFITVADPSVPDARFLQIPGTRKAPANPRAPEWRTFSIRLGGAEADIGSFSASKVDGGAALYPLSGGLVVELLPARGSPAWRRLFDTE